MAASDKRRRTSTTSSSMRRRAVTAAALVPFMRLPSEVSMLSGAPSAISPPMDADLPTSPSTRPRPLSMEPDVSSSRGAAESDFTTSARCLVASGSAEEDPSVDTTKSINDSLKAPTSMPDSASLRRDESPGLLRVSETEVTICAEPSIFPSSMVFWISPLSASLDAAVMGAGLRTLRSVEAFEYAKNES